MKRALAINEKARGPDDPGGALLLNDLAQVYAEQGRYAEAEPLLNRALTIFAKALGPGDTYVALAMNNLARLFTDQGRVVDTERLYKSSLAIYEKKLGPNHPSVAAVQFNLAELYTIQSRYADAEPLFKRALAIDEKAYGHDHPIVASELNGLASVYEIQGRYAEAEPLFKRALAINEKARGPDDPAVARTLNNLAGLFRDQGREGEALPLVRRTISGKTADRRVALPILFRSQAAKLVVQDEAIDDGLNVVQRAAQTAAGEALNALAVRFSTGNDRLAELVRKDQDLAGEAASLDKTIVAAVSKEPSRRDTATEQRIRDRMVAIVKERDDLQSVFAHEFPSYAALRIRGR